MRPVARLIAGDEIAHEIIVHIPPGIGDDAEKIRGHDQELAHRHDIEHLRMHGDQNGGRRAQRRQSEKPKLRRAVDQHDIIALGDPGYGLIETGEEEPVAAGAPGHGGGGFVLKFHQLDIARHKIEARKIGFADDLIERAALIVVAQGPIDRLIGSDIKFRLIAVQGREAGLRIKVNGENPVAVQREILRQMRRRRRLARSALEIDNGENL